MIKIQGLAVIAIIILLPMTLILSSYISSQAKTLGYQVEYDSRLQNSTYDALKAFQMNTSNSDTSDIANSKIRDVKAGANSFFDSLAKNFNMPGYDKETLSEYVPAVVFTMYDGYYIYSPYENTMEQEDADKLDNTIREVSTKTGKTENEIKDEYVTYYNGQQLSGLKPYVYPNNKPRESSTIKYRGIKISAETDIMERTYISNPDDLPDAPRNSSSCTL